MNIPNIIYFQSEKRKENLSYHSEIFSFVRFYDKKKKLVKLPKIYKNYNYSIPKLTIFNEKNFSCRIIATKFLQLYHFDKKS